MAAASGGLMMVRRSDFLALGGFYEPIFMYGEEADYCLARAGKGRSPSRERVPARERARLGPAPVTAADLLVVPQPAAERRAPSLDPGARRIGARLGRLRRDDACAGAKPSGAERDREGLAGRPAPDGTRAAGPCRPQERREATRQLASFREALAEQRRLGRLGLGATGSESHRDVSEACPACGAELPDEPSLRGPDRLFGTPGIVRGLRLPRSAARAERCPRSPSEDLGGLYPGTYDAHRLPGNPALRGARDAPLPPALRTGAEGVSAGSVAGGAARPAAGRGQRPGRSRRRPRRAGLGRDRARALGGGVRGSATTRRAQRARDADDDARPNCPTNTTPSSSSTRSSTWPSPQPISPPRAACSATGGCSCVSLPNFGSWQRRRFGARWFHLDLPRHRTHFSPRGLELLLRRQGFEPLEVATSTSIDGLPEASSTASSAGAGSTTGSGGTA